ncbi:MAG: Txe/YoeB family addiction module toxin [Sphingomonadaceae bacterium]
MKIVFVRNGWTDYQHWIEHDKATYRKLTKLIEECSRSPFTGTGKPEPLRRNLRGWWSRRITDEHRLVYRVVGSGDNQALEILQCRGHY